MNICDKLPLYLYNEMSGEEMLEFREHLLHCRECSCNARLFAKLKNIKTLQSAPPGIIESVLNKTARRGKNSKRRKLVKTAFAAISAAVLAAFLTASETPNSNSAANNKLFQGDLLKTYNDLRGAASNLNEFEAVNSLH